MTQRITLFLLFIVLGLLFTANAFGQDYHVNTGGYTGLLNDHVNTSKQCAPSSQVTYLSELFEERIPYYYLRMKYNSHAIGSCYEKIKSLIIGWEEDDLKVWDLLSNQACSHKNGWVEKEPGTCSAGGPPPICKMDHWMKSSDALSRWAGMERDVYKQRELEIRSYLCSCWSEGEETRLQAEFGQMTNGVGVSTTTPKSNNNTMRLPCVGSPPPGYKCEGGFLVPLNTVVQSVDVNAKMSSIGLAQSVKHLKSIAALLGEGLNYYSLTGSAGMDQYKELPTWFSTYGRELSGLQAQVQQYKDLVEEYEQRKNLTPGHTCKCRELSVLQPLIENLRAAMDGKFKTLNSDYAGVLNERGQCPNCCLGVFEIYQKWYDRYFQALQKYDYR